MKWSRQFPPAERSPETAGRRGFNSLSGHHVFNRLAKIVEVHTKHRFAFIVGGKIRQAGRPESLIYLTVIDFLLGESSESAACHQFCALASETLV